MKTGCKAGFCLAYFLCNFKNTNPETMARNFYRLLVGMTILTVLFFISGCESSTSTENGLLEGTIKIGPICPVEKDPPSPECLPTAETYKAYPVGIWTHDGRRRITQISPALDGSFSVGLDPGQYLVKLDKDNAVGGSNLPITIVISSQEKTTLSIDIDTGIR
jgi:hypothetical protein